MVRERWAELSEFPDYAVSDQGEIHNIKTGMPRRTSVNQNGVVKISMYKGRELHTRSVGVLVAEAFCEGQTHIFNTPMHLDGDRNNCRADNLMWRPRWYAIKFHSQFDVRDFHHMDVEIEDLDSQAHYNSVKECCIAEGHHYEAVYRSYIHGDRMPFTGQVFHLVQ